MPRMSDAKNRGSRERGWAEGADSDKLPLLLRCGTKWVCQGRGNGLHAE